MNDETRRDPRATRARVVIFSLVSSLLLSFAPSGVALRQRSSDDPVATTERFVFHSRFSMNLVDRLKRTAHGLELPGAECLETLPPDQRTAWDGAIETFRELFVDDEGGRRRTIFLRLELAGLGDQVRGGLPPMSEEVEGLLDAAAPAYRTCWWDADDAANRRWIGALVSLLREMEEEVATRLAEAYRTPWHDGKIPVDVVPWVSRQGANTIGPAHILITSSSEAHRGNAALESVFHEASHTIIGPDEGEPSRQLREASRRLGLEVPDGLWHVLIFHTTGEVVQGTIAERTAEEYLPYLYATGLFERAWPELREPVEEWWGAYLDGRISMSRAVEGMLEELSED